MFELQTGVGGDESALFVADLFKMYEAYCKMSNYKLEVIDFSPGNAGGFKNMAFTISGTNAYGTFKRESGCHRVQRVPKTETKGRVHTSIASIIVLPEIQVEDIELNKSDVKVEPYNSGGKGGQHSNKTLNAARLTHLPTGITACSQMKSFPQNLKIAWQVLATRLSDHALQQQNDEESEKRNKVRGTGSRSEKIRTYNFPQDRVTDHRIKKKYSLASILAGDLESLLEDLQN
jgi:peptide chain release factor 1